MEKEYFIIIGENVKILRKKRGYTQQSFAEALKISPNHVSRIENAETRVSLTLLFKIKERLSVDWNELLEKRGDDGETEQQTIEEVTRLLNRCAGRERKFIIGIIHYVYESLNRTDLLTSL